MGWTTLYITGKDDFREEVREQLEDSRLRIMAGYIGAADNVDPIHDLYWVDDKVSLRKVKETIGSKLIWKYRLTFYPTLEAFIESQNQKERKPSLSAEDMALIEEMKAAVR